MDGNIRQSVHEIEVELADAEASAVDAEARFRKATEQLSRVLASMDTAVTRVREGLDRALRGSPRGSEPRNS